MPTITNKQHLTFSKAQKQLRTDKEIICLDRQSYLVYTAVALDLACKNLSRPLAKIVKGWEVAA